MSFITGLLELLNHDGSRADTPNRNGRYQPIALKLWPGANPISRDRGDGVTEVTVTGGGSGTDAIEYATADDFRAASEPADGSIIRILSTNRGYRYSDSSGAGWADDDNVILRQTATPLGSNGRAFSTASSAVCPTFDAMRGLLSGRQDHIHLQSHTAFGDGGGGIFDRKPVGAYVDDNGTIAVAGAYAYVRRDSVNGAVRITDWGADPTGTVSSSDALDAAMLWAKNHVGKRSIRIPAGIYEITRPWVVTEDNLTIAGEGPASTIRWTDTDPTSKAIVVRSSGAYHNTSHLHMRGFRILGTKAATTADSGVTWVADGGHSALEIDGTITYANWDLIIEGGWEHGLYVNQDIAIGGGGIMVCDIKLMINQTVLAPRIKHAVWIYGFANACRITVDSYRLGWGDTAAGRGTGIYLHTNYPSGNYGSKFYGSVQGIMGVPLDLDTCNNITFDKFYIESEPENTLSSVIANSQYVNILGCHVMGSAVTLTNCNYMDLSGWTGPIVETTAGRRNRYPWAAAATANAITRVGLSGTWIGGLPLTGTPDFCESGPGDVDPPNTMPNGDFSRWESDAGVEAVSGTLAAYSYYEAQKCGRDMPDGYRFPGTQHCAKVNKISGDVNNEWRMALRWAPRLRQELIDTSICWSVRYKHVSGTEQYRHAVLSPATWAAAGGGYGGGILCSDGSQIAFGSTFITQDMVSNGAFFMLIGAADSTVYVGEIQIFIGNYAARCFRRCDKVDWAPEAMLSEDGQLTVDCDTVPVGNDPIFGAPYKNGDSGRKRGAVIQTASTGERYITTGWHKIGGYFEPLQFITGLHP